MSRRYQQTPCSVGGVRSERMGNIFDRTNFSSSAASLYLATTSTSDYSSWEGLFMGTDGGVVNTAVLLMQRQAAGVEQRTNATTAKDGRV